MKPSTKQFFIDEEIEEPISAEDNFGRKTIDVGGGRMSYVDEGAGEPVVFLHGNPTSSYLWRNIIPYLSKYRRCLAPDLIGMGRSDKSPTGTYTFTEHAKFLDEWFRQLGLKNIVLVLHDWGSALGFYYAYRNQEVIKGIAYMEALVLPRLWKDFHNGRDAIFRMLRSDKGEKMIFEQNFFIETVLPKSVIRQLSKEEMDTYREPFKNKKDRLPALVFPRELPIEGEPRNIVTIVEEYGEWLSESKFPKLLISAEPGALLTGSALEFCRKWPNQREVTVAGIHYIQEDSPHEIGVAIREFVLNDCTEEAYLR
ncbi:haloalkane dehalogenase [Danxiaibacter flavus]|uniref:Haloalkane dehalogenase n=1 Tax=Danxiaibacter flavus TaxID=3049108 RepID=A0ABV3ZMR6_9BACT|nr:haloalkane dehalogenase [Chitinophagaceae bacterium DXS]